MVIWKRKGTLFRVEFFPSCVSFACSTAIGSKQLTCVGEYEKKQGLTTIQLIEMEVPLVLCLNQFDAAKKKGINIDLKKFEQALGVPVVPTVAIRGEGIYELTKKAVEMAKRKGSKKPKPVKYGSEIEEKIQKLTSSIESKKIAPQYPPRWVAVKLLENDPEIKKLVSSDS